MLPKLYSDRIDYIFTNMDEAVCIIASDGKLLYVNPAAQNLFGFPAGTDAKIWDAIPFVEGNDGLIQLFIDAVMEKKKSFHSLVTYVNHSGDYYQLHISLTYETEGSGSFLIVISDLTQVIKVHSAFVRYTSPDIADYVLNEPEGEKQGGQSRNVSILMSDLRGFTALSTRLPSADLVRMLNYYFEQMAAAVERYHGTIIEFLGDGIFIVFGAPSDLPDHASLAVHCAVEMQNAMAGVNEWNRDHGFPELEMGIGIHSGFSVVGNIGSEKKMKYGCMGENVNLAGRLESLTVGGQILISESTRGSISEELTVMDENSFSPKGASQQMKYYSVTGIGKDQLQNLPPETIRWIDLPKPEIFFYELTGKTVDTNRYTGKMLRISSDRKVGMLSSECCLQPMQNIMLRIGEKDVYAKIITREDRAYRLYFTANAEAMADLIPSEKDN